jgi:hypothetical protein
MVEKSNYKYQPGETAEQIRLRALDLKNKRLLDKQIREEEEKQKYMKDRDHIRKMHE